ncbi:hypothetical protein TWF718_005713 [Orbilia javanica]|uniref:RING-type domain-containing protein n=1 Tax=Orbilia javanica TaxID=47235 RepID=A0AAN8N413_9PEZI
MWCYSRLAAIIVAIFPILARAVLPEIPQGANFAYHIEGDAIIGNRLVPKTINGWNNHPGTRYPEPCFPLVDNQAMRIYTFEHVQNLALNVNFYDVPIRDNDIKFEFFQDDDCRVPNHPRMLYVSGEYDLPSKIKTRIGSFRLIDPLSLAFLRNPHLSRVNPSEDILLKTEERWKRDRRLFDEVVADLSAGNKERQCTICLDSLVEREPSSVLVGDCGHSYHGPCLDRWAASDSERNRRDPVEFRRRTGFPLVQLTSCPDCRKPLNPRKMAKIPTQPIEEEEEKEQEDPRENIRFEPIIRGTPERRRNANANNNHSPTIGPPSLFTTPGSDLEDLINAEYMDERVRGPSRVRRPADYDFQSSFVGDNPLVALPNVQLQAGPDVNDNPVVPHTDYDPTVNEGLSGFNGIGRSLRSGQLG